MDFTKKNMSIFGQLAWGKKMLEWLLSFQSGRQVLQAYTRACVYKDKFSMCIYLCYCVYERERERPTLVCTGTISVCFSVCVREREREREIAVVNY